MNAPKPRFVSIAYQRVRHRTVYELRDRTDDARAWPWAHHRVVALIEALRDAAAARLREGLPTEEQAIERALVGRKADGRDPSPVTERVHIIPLPSIGHRHADRGVRRVVVDVPSGARLRAADVEWAFSGLEPAGRETGAMGPLVLTRGEGDEMLQHYAGPSRHWQSVTAVALPEAAQRRRIEPTRMREEAKGARERAAEQERAAAAVCTALRHAGVSAGVISVRVQREPFSARGARAEAFAEDTRFPKERLWHIELELDRSLNGPLVLGDGRFLGLGVMAPVSEARAKSDVPNHDLAKAEGAQSRPVTLPPSRRSGLYALAIDGAVTANPVALARALRRAVMVRVQEKLGARALGRFFSGHEESGAPARTDHASHLSFQVDRERGRFLLIAPHWLDRREPTWEERRAIDVLERALDDLIDLRAGSDGRFAVRRCGIDADDPILAAARGWISLAPYTVTRHKKKASAAEVLVEDVLAECRRRYLPRPVVTVLDARGVSGRGLEGRLRLDFAVAVAGPIVLGRTRYLGGGLFVRA
jgi:CRISPR-associated protein Csb2